MTPRPIHQRTKSLAKRLKLANDWVEQSGLLTILGPAQLGMKPGAGHPVVHGQYSTRGLLVAMCEMCIDLREMSYTELTRTIWFDYDDAILARLEMPGVRDARSVAEFDAVDPDKNPDPTAAQLHAAELAEDRVRHRIIKAFEQATLPINDNVAPADARHTNAELKRLGKLNDRTEQRAARIAAVNGLIQGSLFAANKARHKGIDPRDLRSGILKGWAGDVAIDETDHDHSIATKGRGTKLTKATAYHPISELVEVFTKPGSRLKWPNALGLSFGIAVSRPENRRVPSVAIAGSIDKPSSGSIPGALAVLDAIDSAGIRPPRRSNSHSYAVVDMAYPHGIVWAAELLKRGYSYASSLRVNRRRHHPLTSTDAPGGVVSAHLLNGVPVCPGLSSTAVAAIKYDAPEQIVVNGVRTYRGEDLHRHDEMTRLLRPVLMPTHGRPVRAPDRGAGRPRAGVQPRPDIFKLRVMCPAVAGEARCPLVPESMEQPPGVPLIPDPPLDNPPPTCRNSFTTLRLTADQFKDYQHRISGSFESADLISSCRSRNEGFHANLYNASSGNLVRGNIKPWKNAFLSLAVAMAVGATNFRVIERWDVVVKFNGGKAPLEPRANHERTRRNVLAAYRANRFHI